MGSFADTARLADLSHWQIPADLDFATAVANGLVGVIAKATQGLGGEDPEFFEISVAAYQSRVALLGAYHFGDGSDGARQARHFLERVRRAYGDDLTGLLLMLDAERNKPQMEVVGAEDFAATIHDSEKRWPWLYMGKDGPTGDGAGLPSQILSNCALGIPKYGPQPGLANLPPGWRFARDANDRGEPGTGVCRGWQFTDGTVHGGPFPGLDRVDQWRLFGVSSLDELRQVWAA